MISLAEPELVLYRILAKVDTNRCLLTFRAFIAFTVLVQELGL